MLNNTAGMYSTHFKTARKNGVKNWLHVNRPWHLMNRIRLFTPLTLIEHVYATHDHDALTTCYSFIEQYAHLAVLRPIHTKRKRERKRKRSKNKWKRSKAKQQTSMKIFDFAFAWCDLALIPFFSRDVTISARWHKLAAIVINSFIRCCVGGW